MRSLGILLSISCLLLLSSCVTGNLRLPSSFKSEYKYNPKVVNSLRSAAVNGVLFQVHDSVFRDLPAKAVDRCRKSQAPTWSNEFLNVLEVMDKNPGYYNKFHIVDFKRGDQAKAEITKDIDGLSYLNITYAKRDVREKITHSTTLPCGDSLTEYLDKDLVTTLIDWPGNEDLQTVLNNAPDKMRIERFQFNTTFLEFLAERQTILRLNSEVAFERNFQGNYFLTMWLDKMADELKTPENLDFVNDWFQEIGNRSNQAKPIQFFGLRFESELTSGVQVDTVGDIARKIGQFREPTYLFMTYKQSNGEYVYSGLKDLDSCLRELTRAYRNILSMGTSDLKTNNESFLSPGYSCKVVR